MSPGTLIAKSWGWTQCRMPRAMPGKQSPESSCSSDSYNLWKFADIHEYWLTYSTLLTYVLWCSSAIFSVTIESCVNTVLVLLILKVKIIQNDMMQDIKLCKLVPRYGAVVLQLYILLTYLNYFNILMYPLVFTAYLMFPWHYIVIIFSYWLYCCLLKWSNFMHFSLFTDALYALFTFMVIPAYCISLLITCYISMLTLLLVAGLLHVTSTLAGLVKNEVKNARSIHSFFT